MTAQACDIEIVEKTKHPYSGDGLGVIVPNEIRINGRPVLAADRPVIVHEISLTDRDAVYVTLTLFARRVTIGEEQEGES